MQPERGGAGSKLVQEIEPDDRDAFWKKLANSAICLLELGESESVWPLFQQTPDPSLRSFLIDRLARLGANHEPLAARIKQESDPASCYALILALGQFDVGNISSQQRQSLAEQLASLYRDNPEPGIHSAAGWALRNWQQDRVATDVELTNAPPKQDRNWFVNSQGQTFAIVTGPVEFLMGDPRYDTKKVTLSHSFAVATHEVTVAQFQKFRSDHKYHHEYSQKPDCPVNEVTSYDAVAYCNWLSEQEGLPRCYEPNDKGQYVKIPAEYLERTGYRLPTEAEWEFACRAGTTSTYGFGEPLELLTKYGWYVSNAESKMWPVGVKLPNSLGLFDMHGNAAEWCHSFSVSQDRTEFSLVRGGAFHDQRWILPSGRSNIFGVVLGHDSVYTPEGRDLAGFRPSRTYNLSP